MDYYKINGYSKLRKNRDLEFDKIKTRKNTFTENNDSFSELNIKKEKKDKKNKTTREKQIKNDKDEEKRSEKNGFNLITGKNREESYFACISMLIEYFEMPTRSESIKRGAQIIEEQKKSY